MRHFKFVTVLLSSFIIFGVTAAAAQTPTATPLPIRLQSYVSGLSSPLLLTNAKDGTRRNFIVQQGGIIKVVQPGSTTPTDFMNITGRIVSGGERGLLGLAFHPLFASNGYFFVNYTRTGGGAGGETVISRFKTTDGTNALGDPNSERILLTIPQPFTNHKGGMIEFRNDFTGEGNLYIGMGDGGSGNDPGNRAQNLGELLGKFLRITPDVSGNNNNLPYRVPSGNPYIDVAGARPEIYAVGMRNPFRWSFDRAIPYRLWAGDVGQNAIEEVDVINSGGNYGWRVYEGNQCTNLDPTLCTPTNYVAPVLQYDHSGGRCSITGGYVYRGTRGSLPNGGYTYGDYCTGEIFLWNNNQQSLLLDTPRNISSFGEDEDGELYVVGLGGTVEKIVRAFRTQADFDGDATADFTVFRPSNGFWYVLNSLNNSFRAQQFGISTDIPASGDYDGDRISDLSVFRPSNGTWYFIRSGNNTFGSVQYGLNGDIPAVADYDGDGKDDLAVARGGSQASSPLFFYILQSSNGVSRSQQWGTTGTDRPVRGDFDGDAKDDIAVYSEAGGIWYVLQSSNNGFQSQQFGAGNLQDATVPADYDGDGKTDRAVFRKSTGVWYILRSSNGALQTAQFGLGTDTLVGGDYDGDGRADISVFRSSDGTWYYLRSSDGAFRSVKFGQNGDLPIAR